MSDDPGVVFRAALAAVPAHLKVQSDAELALSAWLLAHRGVPSDLLYDCASGEPLDPDLARLERAVDGAVADVAWCRAVVVAAGEVVKGEPFGVVAARNEAHRHKIGRNV